MYHLFFSDETEKPKRTGPVDKGKVVDGVVTFSGGDDNKKGDFLYISVYFIPN